MSSDELDELRAMLRAQTKTLNEALQMQTDMVVAALNSYVVRIFKLECEVAALREGQAGEGRNLQ